MGKENLMGTVKPKMEKMNKFNRRKRKRKIKRRIKRKRKKRYSKMKQVFL